MATMMPGSSSIFSKQQEEEEERKETGSGEENVLRVANRYTGGWSWATLASWR